MACKNVFVSDKWLCVVGTEVRSSCCYGQILQTAGPGETRLPHRYSAWVLVIELFENCALTSFVLVPKGYFSDPISPRASPFSFTTGSDRIGSPDRKNNLWLGTKRISVRPTLGVPPALEPRFFFSAFSFSSSSIISRSIRVMSVLHRRCSSWNIQRAKEDKLAEEIARHFDNHFKKQLNFPNLFKVLGTRRCIADGSPRGKGMLALLKLFYCKWELGKIPAFVLGVSEIRRKTQRCCINAYDGLENAYYL